MPSMCERNNSDLKTFYVLEDKFTCSLFWTPFSVRLVTNSNLAFMSTLKSDGGGVGESIFGEENIRYSQ